MQGVFLNDREMLEVGVVQDKILETGGSYPNRRKGLHILWINGNSTFPVSSVVFPKRLLLRVQETSSFALKWPRLCSPPSISTVSSCLPRLPSFLAGAVTFTFLGWNQLYSLSVCSLSPTQAELATASLTS